MATGKQHVLDSCTFEFSSCSGLLNHILDLDYCIRIKKDRGGNWVNLTDDCTGVLCFCKQFKIPVIVWNFVIIRTHSGAAASDVKLQHTFYIHIKQMCSSRFSDWVWSKWVVPGFTPPLQSPKVWTGYNHKWPEFCFTPRKKNLVSQKNKMARGESNAFWTHVHENFCLVLVWWIIF